jgi:hypothetical protein
MSAVSPAHAESNHMTSACLSTQKATKLLDDARLISCGNVISSATSICGNNMRTLGSGRFDRMVEVLLDMPVH